MHGAPLPGARANLHVGGSHPGLDRVTAPASRADCRMSNYVHLGFASWCRRHAVNACPFGVATYPTRHPLPWWRRAWLALKGY